MWTKDDFIMWVCVLGFSCVAFFSGLSAGKQAASKQLREQAVEEGVGFWSVDKEGKTRFVFSKRELPLVRKGMDQEEEERMMMFYKMEENLGVCNGEGCKEIHP